VLEFSDFVEFATSRTDPFKNFSLNNDRLDEFYASMLDGKEQYSKLFEVVKSVLILSHGQAQVESGFSVNSDLLVENLTEESVVAQRKVYGGIHAAGGVPGVELTPSLMSHARSAHVNYTEALRRKKTDLSEEEKRTAEKRRIEIRVQELKAKKSRISQELRDESANIDEELKKLQNFQ
jgi:hypothetical protein